MVSTSGERIDWRRGIFSEGLRSTKTAGEQEAPLARRVIHFTNALGKHTFTFPEGHTFAEDEEKIVASYGVDSLTIHKSHVWDLYVKATYPIKKAKLGEAKEE